MARTTVQELTEIGQSIWLDFISRSLIDTGKLKNMIDFGIRGLTSNPSIFDKAISASNDYDIKIIKLQHEKKSTFEIYDDLTVKDIQDAADIFRAIYDNTKGIDGYVSLEINPKLSYQIEETIAEGKRLFRKVDRPNVLFKVPSTEQGFKAIEELLAQGINVNVTLIFSLQQYMNTAQAYIKGVKRFAQNNGDINRLSSVASVFISRADTQIDELLDAKINQSPDNSKKDLVALKGKAAVANAAIIYSKYREIFSSQQFKEIQKKGARVQRLLWGSTSTKNPVYSDIKYVAELIGENTINTIPEKTLNAFLDHGIVKETLSTEIRHSQEVLDQLGNQGIDINSVCKKLLDEGVAAFEKSFDSLLSAIEEKAKKL
ncbi:MAG: transaldolase [bacterium]